MRKATLARAFTKWILNRFTLPVAGWLPGWAILETRGRRTGRARRVTVGDGLRGDVFWIVAEHGCAADYVRNLIHDPRVRLQRRGRWRAGTARVVTDRDPRAVQRDERLDPLNATLVRLVGSDLLAVRIDLDTTGTST